MPTKIFIKKWLLTTVVCSGFAFAGIHAAPADAATVLQPNSDWAVSRLESAQPGGQPYCALARRFSNNLILTLARNAADESSLALDFQKTALNNAQNYNITLRPGFGQDRLFNIRPISGKAVVLRLGQDYAFYDALSRSGKLSVDVSGQSYDFSLSGFAEGQKKLTACLVNLVEPAAGADVAPMVPLPPPVAQAPARASVIPASAEIQTLPPAAAPVPAPAPVVQASNAELQALQEENVRLRNALERERRNYEDRYLREGESSSLAAEMGEKLRLLEMENAGLRDRIAAAPVPVAPAIQPPQQCPVADTSEYARTAAALEKEIATLRDENLRLIQQGQAAPQHDVEIAALRDENARLRQGTLGVPQLEAELAALRAENGRLRQDGAVAGQLELELAALRDENARLKQGSALSQDIDRELAGLREDNVRLKQEIAATRARSELLEQQIAEGKVPAEADAAIVGTLRERISLLEAENKDLQDKNAVLSKGGSDVPVSLAQLRSIEEQLRYVEQDRDKLLGQLDQIREGKGQGLLDISSDNWNLEQATRRFNEAEREIQRLGRQLEEARTQCAAEKKNLEYMLFDPEVAKQEQISRLMNLENKVNDAQIVLDRQRLDYEEKIAVLAKKSEGFDATLNIQKAEYQQKIAVLEKELAGRTGPSPEIQARLTLLQNELAAKEAQAKDALQELADVRQELAAREAAVAGAKAQVAAIQKDAVSNGAATAEMQGRIALLERELQEARFAANQGRPEEDRLRREKDQLASEKTALQADKLQLSQRIETLEAQIAAAVETAAGPTADPDSELRIAKLMRDNADLIHQRNMLEQERNILAERETTLSRKVSSLESALAGIPTGAGVNIAAVAARPEPVSTASGDAGFRDETGYPYDFPVGTGKSVTAAPPVSRAEPTAAPYEEFSGAVARAVAPATSIAAAPLMTADVLRKVLERAKIPLVGAIEQTGAESGLVSYSWDAGGVFGTAEQQALGDSRQFDTNIAGYIEKTKSRCDGQFAAVPAFAEEAGSIRVSSFEIACIRGNIGATASVIFYTDGGNFTTFAHETVIDDMDAAMDLRDRLTQTLLQTKVAAR